MQPATAISLAVSLTCAVVHAVPPQIIAHRGASQDAPENTLAAFRLAWEQGADGIEADIQLTKDGHIVCIHDADTRKVAGRKLVVSESTLAQLRQLDVGAWHDAQFRGERIPTLAEVLDTVPPGKSVYLDLKAGKEIITPLLSGIAASGVAAEQIVVLAFDAAAILELKDRAPQLTAHWLCRIRKTRFTRRLTPTLDEVLATLRESRSDGLASRHSDISDAFIRGITEHGYEHRVWTVNCVKSADRFAKLGTTSIITDVPQMLRAHFHGQLNAKPARSDSSR